MEIGAFCLMPNHFHLLLQEITAGGIAKFMQKVGTSYGMYFNSKYERTGNVFVKPFRSRHVDDDIYLRHVASYIHLNPADLFEPQWKGGVLPNATNLLRQLEEYPYSSLGLYADRGRPERTILSRTAQDFLKELLPPFAMALNEAIAYYGEMPDE